MCCVFYLSCDLVTCWICKSSSCLFFCEFGRKSAQPLCAPWFILILQSLTKPLCVVCSQSQGCRSDVSLAVRANKNSHWLTLSSYAIAWVTHPHTHTPSHTHTWFKKRIWYSFTHLAVNNFLKQLYAVILKWVWFNLKHSVMLFAVKYGIPMKDKRPESEKTTLRADTLNLDFIHCQFSDKSMSDNVQCLGN